MEALKDEMNTRSITRGWPPQAAFISCRGATFEVDDGAARFCGVAVCDANEQPTLEFTPGQKAYFYFEYEILRTLATPIGGFSFRDASGLVIHGNTTIQQASPSPDSVPIGTRLRFALEVQLDISLGDYWFSLGLSSTTSKVFDGYCFADLSYRDMESQISIHSHIKGFGPFTVRAEPKGKLLHHGLVNLPSEIVVSIADGFQDQPVPTDIQTQRLQHDLLNRSSESPAATINVGKVVPLVSTDVGRGSENVTPKDKLQSFTKNHENINLVELVSYPRSGNTWLRNLIEFYFDRKVSSIYAEGQDNFLIESGDQAELFLSYLNGFAPIKTRKKLLNGIGEIFNDEMRCLLTNLNDHFFIKSHELPHEKFVPGEAVVYVVRHPAACIWSYYKYLGKRLNDGVARPTVEDVIWGRVPFGSWSAHVDAWLRAGETLGSRFQLLRFETLGVNEAELCQNFSKLTGLPRRGFVGTFPAFEYWQKQAPDFFGQGEMNDWHSSLTAEQIDLIYRLHGDTARRVGYEMSRD